MVATPRVRAINLRPAAFEDHPQIARLATRYNLDFEEFEVWQHLWANNPVYQSVRDSWPMGWVLETAKRDIVGYIGNIPLECEFRGKKLLTSTSRSWVVDTAHRSYAPLLLDSHFSDKQVDLFLHPTPNVQASGAYTSVNAQMVPAGEWDKAAFWITSYGGFAASLLAKKVVPMARFLSIPLAAGLGVRDSILKPRWSAEDDSLLELCDHFDERFEVFWRELRKRNPQLLLSVRSREALQWHFEYALREERAWVVVAAESGRIKAYSIFYRNDNPAIGLKRMRLVDYQSLDDGAAALLPMLAWALKRCRKQRIHVLESVGFQPCASTFVRDHAPHKRQLPSWTYYYRARDKNLTEALGDRSVWSPSGFDGDVSL